MMDPFRISGRWLCRLAPAIVLVVTATTAAGQALQPDDFARGIQVDTVDGTPVQAVIIPPVVYRTVTRADLGDLRVFNGRGEELPHAVYRGGSVDTLRSPSQPLPFFPLRGRPGDDVGRLTVQVRRTPSGALVRVDERPDRRGGEQPVRAYLVDASSLDVPLHQLAFSFADTTADFIAEVAAETSDDLSTWQRWGAPTTLARLRYGTHTLRRTRMALPPRAARYVRISWSGGDLPSLDRLVVTPSAREEMERQWASFEASVREEGIYLFDQQGVVPAERVRFRLPQPNTLARGVLVSAPAPDGPWTTRYRGLLYRLRVDEHELSTLPLSMPRTTDRYWRLTVDPAGGGLGRGTPDLELGWTSEWLLFVPRGEPPYTLAFGSASVAPSAFDADELLRLLPEQRSRLFERARAGTGPVVELGGDRRLEPATELPWSRIALWLVLVLGVVLLAAMSIRLIRQIDRDRQGG